MLKFTKDSFVQNLAKGRLVVPYLESFDKLDEEWTFTYHPKEGDDAWHPSGDCVPPVSELYAKALSDGKRAPLSPGTQRNFMVGHFWHALVQRILCDKLGFCESDSVERRGHHWWGEPEQLYRKEDLYYGRHPEVMLNENTLLPVVRSWPDDRRGGTHKVKPKPYHWSTGSGDIAPLVLPGGWQGVFDIKTMAGSMWKQSWKSGLLPSAFADKYEAQVNVYMDFFDEEKALILGVNKDAPHGFVEFEFERNPDLIDTIYAKWEYVAYCLAEGIEPDPKADGEFTLPFTGPIS